MFFFFRTTTTLWGSSGDLRLPKGEGVPGGGASRKFFENGGDTPLGLPPGVIPCGRKKGGSLCFLPSPPWAKPKGGDMVPRRIGTGFGGGGDRETSGDSRRKKGVLWTRRPGGRNFEEVQRSWEPPSGGVARDRTRTSLGEGGAPPGSRGAGQRSGTGGGKGGVALDRGSY